MRDQCSQVPGLTVRMVGPAGNIHMTMEDFTMFGYRHAAREFEADGYLSPETYQLSTLIKVKKLRWDGSSSNGAVIGCSVTQVQRLLVCDGRRSA